MDSNTYDVSGQIDFTDLAIDNSEEELSPENDHSPWLEANYRQMGNSRIS